MEDEMAELEVQLVTCAQSNNNDFPGLVNDIAEFVTDAGYEIVEQNADKPWGAYLRLNSAQADRFIDEFFPGLSPQEARLGIDDAELSPKFLLVKPSERLSWQYHHRRAERWRFLTDGAYRRSETNEENDRLEVSAGEVVQFQKGERHRLEGMPDAVVLVAEIWQHVDAADPSNEDDIVRVSDDYVR